MRNRTKEGLRENGAYRSFGAQITLDVAGVGQMADGFVVIDRGVSTLSTRLQDLVGKSVLEYSYPDVEKYKFKFYSLSVAENIESFSGKGHAGVFEHGRNSARININFNKHDDLEKLICSMFSSFLQKRADYFEIVRRAPVSVNGSKVDISFLLSEETEKKYEPARLSRLLTDYIKEHEKDKTSMKIYTNSKSRSVGALYFSEFI